MKPGLSWGKLHGLQRCSTPRGALAVLAQDHRDGLRRLLQPADPAGVPDAELVAFKQAVVQALAPAASAVLLDPEFGAAQCLASGALPGGVGLIVTLDATGYEGQPHARASARLPGWTVAKIKRMGAAALKLLVYYHPQSASAPAAEALVAQVAQECAHHDLLFFLETLTFAPVPGQTQLQPDERRRAVIESAARLTTLGGDIYKAEFPLDASAVTDPAEWEAACAELSAASRIPWVLLSGSADFPTFLRQVTAACRGGASGVAVGRAVWREAPALAGAERLAFLQSVARPRLARLHALCEALARPWTDFYETPLPDRSWYLSYENGPPAFVIPGKD